jgi:hypothetical protein
MRTLHTDQPENGLRIVGDRHGHGSITEMDQTPRRRVPFLILAAVAVIAAALAVVITATGHHRRNPAAHAPAGAAAGAPSTPAASTPAAATATTSTPAPLVTAIPTTPPTGVTWQLFQGVALPFSPTDGPTRITGTVYAGYSHTPYGALIAQVQISARYLITPNGGWRPVVEQQVMPGTQRDTYAKARATSGDDPPPSGYSQIAGFRFVTYTADLAVISMASRSSGGGLASYDATMRWVDGDWKYELPPIGTQLQPLTDLTNYTPWQGVS